MFWLKLMYLLELTFHTVKVVWLTFFVYGFPFLLECFANWTELFLLSLLRNLCQGCRYIGIVVVFLFFSSFCISVVWSVFIGRTRVFSKFIVEPVALLSFSKKSITGSIDFFLLVDSLNHPHISWFLLLYYYLAF